MKSEDNINKISSQINLLGLFSILLRNKKLIAIFTFLGIIAGSFLSLTHKNIYSGNFQIVLTEKEQSNPLASLGANQFLYGLRSRKGIETQVEILKSPSVLIEIFEYVKSYKNLEKLRFSTWKNSLIFQIPQKSLVLDVEYRDTEEKLILPVLEKISSKFKKYTNEKNKDNYELTKSYLNEQIIVFKNKSIDSLKALQDFATNQDLNIVDSYTPSISDYNFDLEQLDSDPKNSLNNIEVFSSNISIEQIRVKAANEIRRIDAQIKKIEELNDDKDIQYIGSTIPGLVNEGLPEQLKSLNYTIERDKFLYKNNDTVIKKSIEERDKLIKLLKQRAIGYLKAKKLSEEAKMRSAMRPKGVLLRYKELRREAQRAETTLINLENQLSILELNEAKSEDPWDLITSPTLLPYPIGISRLGKFFISIVFGLFAGIFYSFFHEFKSSKIFTIKDLEYLIQSYVICEIPFNDPKIYNENMLLFFKKLITPLNGDIGFILSPSIPDEKIIKIQDIFKEYIKGINYKISKSVSEICDYENVFLITSLDYIKKSEILLLKEKFYKNNINISGLINFY